MDNLYIAKPIHIVLKASNCQSGTKFSDSSKGKQCMTNSLLFMSYTMLKHPMTFCVEDLDYILEAGDYLYKVLAQTKLNNDLVLYSDLPNIVYFRNLYHRYKLCANYFGTMAPDYSLTLGMSRLKKYCLYQS